MERDRQQLLCLNWPSERRVLTRDVGPQRFQEQHICFLVHAQKATIFMLIVCLKKIKKNTCCQLHYDISYCSQGHTQEKSTVHVLMELPGNE